MSTNRRVSSRTVSSPIADAARAALVAGIVVAGLAGCSGSSSGGNGGGPHATTSASAPLPGVTKPGGHGPDGDITAPAYNPPESTSPGGSTVFPKVTKSVHKAIADHVVALPGVRSVAYYPQFKQFQVYFKVGVTSAQRQVVHDYVVAHTD